MAGSAEDEAAYSKAEFEVYDDEGVSPDKGLSSAMEVLSGVDLDLACSSEKLVNLHILLSHTLGWDDFEEMGAVKDESNSDEFVAKALVFDLLSGLLDGEVVELESYLNALQMKLIDARQRVSLFKQNEEMFTVMEERLHVSEESWNQFREKILEMKMLSAKLQQSLLVFQNRNRAVDDGEGISELPIIGNSVMRIDNQRDVLRMLEKSLARELDLERKFLEASEREEELKPKLHYTEQVVSHLEEASEDVLARFLEADNAAEVLLGTSKESLNWLQIVQFNLNASLQRENDLKTRLENCLDQLKVKEEIIQKLQAQATRSETCISCEREDEKFEMLALREKVKLLEGKLNESESRSQTAAATSNDAHEVKLGETVNMVGTLRETIAIAESRAESAEAKLSILTETNLELTEELGFLKSNDPNVEKVTLLEKQLRDFEIQLQYAKAAAEASQEQQTLLYTAIWDMETLIEDLKSKVSKYESKIESSEEQCLLLSETNFELNKELSFLRDRLEFVEASLEDANSEKLSILTDINIKSKLIMDMVAQIATERERVQNQLTTLAEENKVLAEKLSSRSKRSATVPDILNGKIRAEGPVSNATFIDTSLERDDRVVV